MNSVILIFVVLIVKNSLAIANVKSNPIAINDKSELKMSDLKVEEARFRDPMPEYYDRDRNNFVTSYGNNNNYGYGDRYGLKYNNNDRDRYSQSKYELLYAVPWTIFEKMTIETIGKKIVTKATSWIIFFIQNVSYKHSKTLKTNKVLKWIIISHV